MTDEVISGVETQLLRAERDHEERSADLDGLERVLLVLYKLGKVRDAKVQQMEDTNAVESLLGENHTKLGRILEQHTEQTMASDINFFAWANAIESDFRAQDPLMLSFDSGSEEEGDRLRSSRLSRRDEPGSRREGSMSSKGGGTLLQVLKSNGKFKSRSGAPERNNERDDRFFCLTTVAWAFAVIGMMITIGFLTGDFWIAQKNVAIQIERSAATPLELPAVTICGDLPNVPSFFDYPTKDYPGLPLFGVSTYVRTNRSTQSSRSDIRFPNTLPTAKDSPLENVVVAQDGARFKDAPQGFDVNREMHSLNDIRSSGSFEAFGENGFQGFYCFRIGKKKREVLYPFGTNRTEGLLQPSVQIRLFKSRLFGACRAKYFQRDPVIYKAFAGELYRFADGLQEQGILDFNGHDSSVLNKTFYELASIDYRIDFYCNAYFFSGFFYPSIDNASISYRYNPDHPDLWEKTGDGPYYSAYSWEANAPLLVGPDVRALERDTYTLNAIQLFAEEAAVANDSGIVSPETGMAILDMTSTSIYTFQKVNVRGKNEYRVKEGLSHSPRLSFRVVDLFQVNLDFSTFETERILTAPTMSWPEFLTDVFEFVGLFTGICIFTLIVAPAHSLV